MPPYQVLASFLSVNGRQKDLASVATMLKNSGDAKFITSSVDYIARCDRRIDRIIWGNAMPKDVKHLGNGANCYFFKPESLVNEICWILTGLRRYKKQIRRFVEIRDAVERHILLGEYPAAKDLLEQSVHELGYTVWYYEMQLVIFGYQEDLGGMLSTVTQLNKEKEEEKSGIVTELLYSMINRSYRPNSAIEYDNELLSTYKRNRNEFQNDRYNYFLLRLNYYQHYDIDDLSVTLIMESLNPAIDRYILLLYILRSYLVKEPKRAAEVCRFASKLYRMSGDSQLYPFLALQNVQSLPEDYYSSDFIHILDCYYTGKYDDTVTACRNFLRVNPSNFDVIKIYCRSLLFLHRSFGKIGTNADSLLNEIAHNVYCVMTEKENDDHKDTLYKLNKCIYGFQMAAGLDFFIREERNVNRCEMLRLLSMIRFNPHFCSIFEDDADRLQYIEQALARVPRSKSLDYQRRRILKEVIEDTSIVTYKRDIDNAKILFEKGKYEEALDNWNAILSDNSEIIPTAQIAVEYIFRSYLLQGVSFRQKAVKFYVDKYLENKAFVSKVDTRQFLEEIKRERYSGIRNNIDFLLFIFLNAEKYPQKQFALEQYCKYVTVDYPSELIDILGGKSPEKVKLFFTLLLTDDVLYHHYKLRSTTDVLDEKLKILSFLRNRYPEEERYSAIHTELMHELIAYNSMKSLDDSKIYVNEEAVLKYDLKNVDDLYERFKKQAALNADGRTYVLVTGLDFSNENEPMDVIKSAAKYSDNVVAEAATQLFSVIRRAFLKSRFGLGTYLSTRIRHGVFEGELRSDLTKLHLVYSTEGSNYIPTPVWRKDFALDPKTNDALNRHIIDFSKKVDTLITGFKDKVIQIHVDENDKNEGCFNYEVSTDEICTRLVEIETRTADADGFCREVFKYLWEITERNLEAIRGKVRDELNKQMFSLLTELETSVSQLTSVPMLPRELRSNINKARENLTGKLAKVEKWFYRQETKYDDFLLDDHMQMAMDAAIKYMPDLRTDGCRLSLKTKLHIRSEYSAFIFDLFSIFFTNMLKYCKKNDEFSFGIDAEISTGKILHLRLVNDLPDGTDEETLNCTFTERMNDQNRLQKEKGSGLVKAANILKYELGNMNNHYDIRAKDGKCITDIYISLNDILAPTANAANFSLVSQHE